MPSPGAHDPIADDELEALFAPLQGRPLALAVSGGADSMALMQLVARWRECSLGTTDAAAPVVVLTIDHGLRLESAEEARWVAQQARTLGFPHHTLVWEGEKPASGVQAAARAARYRLAGAFLARESQDQMRVPTVPTCARWLVTAHHLDDAAETFLMRLARGSGIDGLSAMEPTSVMPVASATPHEPPITFELARPLLSVPKSRLVATLRDKGVPWREDPSNTNPAFERVRIRQGLQTLARLGIEPAQIARSAQRLRGAVHIVARFVDILLATAVETHDGLMAEFGDQAELGRGTLVLGTDIEIWRRLVTRLLTAYGGEAIPAQLSQVEELTSRLHLMANDTPVANRLTLGGCVVDFDPKRQHRCFRIWREPGRRGLPELALEPGQRLIWDQRFEIEVSMDARAGTSVRALGPEGWRALQARVPSVSSRQLQREAVETLPAIWQNDTVVAVPWFPFGLGEVTEVDDREWTAWIGSASTHYSAHFVGLDRVR